MCTGKCDLEPKLEAQRLVNKVVWLELPLEIAILCQHREAAGSMVISMHAGTKDGRTQLAWGRADA